MAVMEPHDAVSYAITIGDWAGFSAILLNHARAMKFTTDSLVLYKSHPARVLAVGEKIEIALIDGQTKRVRPKDIAFLHPGPVRDLVGDLIAPAGEVEEAWTLLEGGETNLPELADLIYATFTPASAWTTWQQVMEGLYFSGPPEQIRVHGQAEVAAERARRHARETARQEWETFIARLRSGQMLASDRERLSEVERVASGQADHSRILEALGLTPTRENAHQLLIQTGYWTAQDNPYPARCGIRLTSPMLPVPVLPNTPRRDLTHLAAYAIDDEGNQDPDDALSWDGERIWVHVADVAALVTPESPLDQEARARGANLYLPERMIPMLPEEITRNLGLGLQPISPALSLGFRYSEQGITDLEIVPSWVRVARLSYTQVETQLDQEPFHTLELFTQQFRAQRHAQHAVFIELPEVMLRVKNGEIDIRPITRLRSRELVTDAMLMAGAAVAQFCQCNNIPIPYATQPAPEQLFNVMTNDLAGMWAGRRLLKPSRLSVESAPHAGLGLECYTRATSPLRRYSDLLVHQQLSAYLTGATQLTADEITARISEAELGSIAVRRAERFSNTHWKLIWLSQHSDWRGEAVVIERDANRVLALIPALALDVKLRLLNEVDLNTRLRLKIREINLPQLTCHFSAWPV